MADTAFYLAVLAAVSLRHWQVLRERSGILGILLALEAIRVVFDAIKYRKMASYHTYSAKLWGVLLAAATIALLCFNRGFWLVTVAIAWGIVCDLEGLTMSILLPKWMPDLKHLGRALQARRELLAKA
jgi:CDP-diacylglycerol--glycerol-3-phosphate 3-phosphatidyltransferase